MTKTAGMAESLSLSGNVFERDVVYLQEAPSFYKLTLPVDSPIPEGSAIIESNGKESIIRMPAVPGDILVKPRSVLLRTTTTRQSRKPNSDCFVVTVFDGKLWRNLSILEVTRESERAFQFPSELRGVLDLLIKKLQSYKDIEVVFYDRAFRFPDSLTVN